MREVRCPLCGADDAAHVMRGRDRWHGLPGWFWVVRCRRCGMCYQNPQPAAEDLHRYYPADYQAYRPRPRRKERLGRRLRRAARAAVLRRFEGYPGRAPAWAVLAWPLARLDRRNDRSVPFRRPGRLLDVGCGVGGFLAEMQTLGWQVQGVEPDETAARHAREVNGLRVLTGDIFHASLPVGGFDAVTFWHALEHVPEPRAVLARARDLLRPGGLLVAQVPNSEGCCARWFGPDWHGLDLPRHLTHFSDRTLRRMLRAEGFRVLRMRHERLAAGWTWSLRRRWPGSGWLHRRKHLWRAMADIAALLGRSDCVTAVAERPGPSGCGAAALGCQRHTRGRVCHTKGVLRLRHGRVTARVIAEADCPENGFWLRDPEALMAGTGAEVVKDDAGITVVRSSVMTAGGPRPVYVKRFSARKWRHRLRPSRAVRSWRLARNMLERGVPTPRPIAAIHRRRWGPFTGASYFVTEEVADARSLYGLLAGETVTLADRAAVASALGGLLATMHACGFSHRDLKLTNILVRLTDVAHPPPGVIDSPPRAGAPQAAALWLLDLDGVRRARMWHRLLGSGGLLGAPGRWRIRDLARLLVAVQRLEGERPGAVGRDACRAFLEGYLGPATAPGGGAAWCRRIAARAARLATVRRKRTGR